MPGEQFATSVPDLPDPSTMPGVQDFDAMSPDSWEFPSSQIFSGPQSGISADYPLTDALPFQGLSNQSNGPPVGFVPSQPASDASPQFLPSNFRNGNGNPFLLPGGNSTPMTRYPLENETSSSMDGEDKKPLSGKWVPPPPVPPGAMRPQYPPQNSVGGYPDVSKPNQASALGLAAPVPTGVMQNGQAIGMSSGPALESPNYFHPGHRPLGDPSIQLMSPKIFRPDLGHRREVPTVRHFGTPDRGQSYAFEEKKKAYPGIGEIFATGRYFGSVTLLLLEPHFQANTAVSITGPTYGMSQTFQFETEAGPRIELGFESRFGPGVEFTYWQIDGDSDPLSFVSTGTNVGQISTYMLGPKRWSRLTTSAAGQTLSAVHEIDVEQFGISFFKEVQLPISRINGRFGFQYVKIFQSLDASLQTGTSTETLVALSDMEAYGPQLTFEYFRPVGHTKLEFVTVFGASVLFGDRNQSVSNTLENYYNNTQSNEFITAFEFFSGIQYRKNLAEKRALFGRFGIDYSTWIGGGTSNDPQGDFGLRGFSIAVGYNR